MQRKNGGLNLFFDLFRSTTEDIQWRITLRILNEAARCLEEKIINSPVCLILIILIHIHSSL